METIKISSNFFLKNKGINNYLRGLDYINSNQDLSNIKDFLKENNKEFFANINKYKDFLVYGDVQSGKTNNLIYIAEKMSSNYDYNVILFLAGTSNDLMFQNQLRFNDAFMKMDKTKYAIINSQGQTRKNISYIAEQIEKNKTIIIHSIKRIQTLNDIYTLLKGFNSRIKILIIDDEGDEASLSAKTSNEIKRLMSLNAAKKISITASPFSNLYKHVHSYDYFYKLKSPKGYMGIKSFGKENFVIYDENKSKDNELILKPLVYWMDITAREKLKKSQILFNIFSRTDKHEKIGIFINELIWRLKDPLEAKKMIEKNELNYDYKIISEFACKLEDAVIISNSKEKENIRKNFEIIVGGFKLSRGITYESLVTEVMINMGSEISAGTLIQRARWFGYRGEMKKFIKIYLTNDVKEAFDEVEQLIDLTKRYQLSHRDYKKQVKNMVFERIKI